MPFVLAGWIAERLNLEVVLEVDLEADLVVQVVERVVPSVEPALVVVGSWLVTYPIHQLSSQAKAYLRKV